MAKTERWFVRISGLGDHNIFPIAYNLKKFDENIPHWIWIAETSIFKYDYQAVVDIKEMSK